MDQNSHSCSGCHSSSCGCSTCGHASELVMTQPELDFLQELGPSGIRVNAVAPGVITTDMCASVDPQIMEQLREDTPVGRNGTPADVAQAMVYLADATFVTGHVLSVNGGYVI